MKLLNNKSLDLTAVETESLFTDRPPSLQGAGWPLKSGPRHGALWGRLTVEPASSGRSVNCSSASEKLHSALAQAVNPEGLTPSQEFRETDYSYLFYFIDHLDQTEVNLHSWTDSFTKAQKHPSSLTD